MVNTEIRLIIFFAAKDGDALYSQQKQDQELTVAQIMNSLLPNTDLNWRKQGKPLGHSGMIEIKSLIIIQWKWEIDLRAQETGIRTIPVKKKCKQAKWLSGEEDIKKRWQEYTEELCKKDLHHPDNEMVWSLT